ncbi:MAG: M50 family metallopeptidase, partial [Acidobacteriota bacterium]
MFYKGKNGQEDTYIIGSKDVDRYVVIPFSKLSIVKGLLSFFDGKHSINWIQDHYYTVERKSVDVMMLYKKLAEAGLIINAPLNMIKKGNIEKMSLKLLQLPAQQFFAALKFLATCRARAILILSLSVILIGTVLAVGNYGLLLVPFSRAFNQTNSVTPITYFILIFISFALHEIAHGLMAVRYGLTPARFEVALYLGFIPMFFLRITGLYTLSSVRRMVVWFAGIYWNLFFASVCVIVLHWLPILPAGKQLLLSIALANYSIAILNMVPFLPTDGYFILSTALGRYNLRTYAWHEFFKLFTWQKSKISLTLIIYFTCTLTIIVSLLIRNIFSISNATTGFTIGLLRLGLFLLPLLIFVTKLIKELQAKYS